MLSHYIDVIMTTRASQITSLTVVYSTVYSDAYQSKHQSSASLTFVWGIHRDRWIPRTKGQLRGKCFHLMTSSWNGYIFCTCHGSTAVMSCNDHFIKIWIRANGSFHRIWITKWNWLISPQTVMAKNLWTVVFKRISYKNFSVLRSLPWDIAPWGAINC